MRRCFVRNTTDASCGPDESQMHWPWPKHHASQSASTNFEELQSSAEAEQHQEDVDYIQNYYEKMARKRKKHRENSKQRLYGKRKRYSPCQKRSLTAGNLLMEGKTRRLGPLQWQHSRVIGNRNHNPNRILQSGLLTHHRCSLLAHPWCPWQ